MESCGERISKRDYERLEKQKDKEITELREQVEDLLSVQRQNQNMQVTIDLLKAQFEREKRMVEDKVREVTAGVAREVDLRK